MAENTSPIQVYIESAADPSIGGFTIPLPTTRAALAPWFAAIQADMNVPGSIAIGDIKSDVFRFRSALGVELALHTSLDELNYLAYKLQNIPPVSMDVVHAALEADRYSRNAADLINLTENLTCFALQPAFNAEGYGEFLLETDKDNTSAVFDRLEKSEDAEEREFAQYILRLEAHVDVKAYARAVIEQEKGTFTDQGYLVEYGQYKEVYHELEDIPSEYRIFTHDGSPSMDKEQFWQIIDNARGVAGGWQDMYTPLRYALSKLDVQDIVHWQQIFDEYQNLSRKNLLWAAADVMLRGCSDDSFDYFRGWLAVQGKDVFMNALADPDSLAKVKAVRDLAREVIDSEYMTPSDGYRNDARFETMLYIGAKAYEEKTGGDYYDDCDNFPLSQQEKSAIADEIKYADGSDVDWFNGRIACWELVPRLYGAFYPTASERVTEAERTFQPAEKESVLAKIREAKAAARNAPVQEKEHNDRKKSYEPEV